MAKTANDKIGDLASWMKFVIYIVTIIVGMVVYFFVDKSEQDTRITKIETERAAEKEKIQSIYEKTDEILKIIKPKE